MEDQRKGFFPHKFNLPSSYAYEGECPPIDQFVDSFTPLETCRQVANYIANFNGSWSFRDEMHKYLWDDVKTLRAGCLCLVKEFFTFQQELDADTQPIHCFSHPYFTGEKG